MLMIQVPLLCLLVSSQNPPIISLDLLGAQIDERSIAMSTDGFKRTCRGQSTCDQSQGHVYAKTCHVLDDNSSSCGLPSAQAFDHHSGIVDVIKTVRLVMESPRGDISAPHRVSETMAAVNYGIRGEYSIEYDAEDGSGNTA